MVTPFYHPVIGGTESFIESISHTLNQKGITVDILTLNLRSNSTLYNENVTPIWENEVCKVNGINVIKVPSTRGIRIFSPLGINFIPGKLLNHLKNYDILHFHNETDLTLPLFSFPAMKPKILHCHCLDVSYFTYKKYPISLAIFRKIANIYIAVSNPICDLLIRLGIPREKIRIVPNAVNTELFKPSHEIKGKNLLLFVGRIQPKKGLHILLESLEYLRTPVKLAIIGPLSSLHPDYKDKVFALIKEINKKRVHEVAYLGVKKRGKLIKFYQKASVFVCPSLSEPFGIVNLEALSCETPVVASRVGGIPEVVKHGVNGILVQPGNPRQLAQSIQRLLDNENIRQKYGREGRKMVIQHFSQEIVVRQLCHIYGELIAKF